MCIKVSTLFIKTPVWYMMFARVLMFSVLVIRSLRKFGILIIRVFYFIDVYMNYTNLFIS